LDWEDCAEGVWNCITNEPDSILDVPRIGGIGIGRIAEAMRLEQVKVRRLVEDLVLTGDPNI